jgi:hypothetical protein
LFFWARISSECHIAFSSHVSLSSSGLWQFQTLFLMTLTFLRTIGRVFYRMPLYWNLMIVSPVDELWVLKKKTAEVKWHFHHRLHGITIILGFFVVGSGGGGVFSVPGIKSRASHMLCKSSGYYTKLIFHSWYWPWSLGWGIVYEPSPL